MKSIKLFSVSFVLLAAISTNANAWFFFLIPTSFGSKKVDGDTCVKDSTKVGDTFGNSNGNISTITKLSGTSSACKDPLNRILATVDYSTQATFLSKAGIDVPDGFKPEELTDRQKFYQSILIKAKKSDTYFQVVSIKRSIISDMAEYVKKQRSSGASIYDDSEQTEIEQTTINGVNAWRYETKGKLKNLFGTRYTNLMTILEGEYEVLLIEAWAPTSTFEKQIDELKLLATSVTGLKGSPSADNFSTTAPVIAKTEHLEISSKPTAAVPASIVTAPTSGTPPSQTRGVSDKLADLKRLLKDGLIDQKDYDAKKKEILKLM